MWARGAPAPRAFVHAPARFVFHAQALSHALLFPCLRAFSRALLFPGAFVMVRATRGTSGKSRERFANSEVFQGGDGARARGGGGARSGTSFALDHDDADSGAGIGSLGVAACRNDGSFGLRRAPFGSTHRGNHGTRLRGRAARDSP